LGNSWIGSEPAKLDASPRAAGLRVYSGAQRSWSARRPVNAGLLALANLQGESRRRLLGAWVESNRIKPSVFGADSLVDFIAERLPDPSPELALCRVEQLTLRAAYRAKAFKAPEAALLNQDSIVCRARHAGVVMFPGGSELVLKRLLPLYPLPSRPPKATPLLVAPGMQPLLRVASEAECETWTSLPRPTVVSDLLRTGGSLDVVGTLLRLGALDYA
jgi:hypothetical protein